MGNGVLNQIRERQEELRSRVPELSVDLVVPTERLFRMTLEQLTKRSNEMVLLASREQETFKYRVDASYRFEFEQQFKNIQAILAFTNTSCQQISSSEWALCGPQVHSWIRANANSEISPANLRRAWHALRALDHVVVSEPPVITTQPKSQDVPACEMATFSVTVIGTSPFEFQWLRNGDEIVGATLSSFSTVATEYSEARYSVRVKNVAGEVVSKEAVLKMI